MELLRQFVDGELSAEDHAAFEKEVRADPELAARVQFEERLRDRVAERFVHDAPAAPAGLVAAVRDLLERDGVDEVDGSRAIVSALRGDLQPSRLKGKSKKAARERSSLRISPMAVAACLLIVAGAVVIGIWGKPLLSPRVHPQLVINLQKMAESAGRADERHHNCSHEATGRPREDGSSTAMRDFARQQGIDIVSFDLAPSQLTLIEEGPCKLGDGEAAWHAIYSTSGGERLSMFIMADRSQFGRLEVARIFDESDFGNLPNDAIVTLFSDGDLAFIVVSSDLKLHRSVLDSMQRILFP
ncbi:MAG: anti-sigma factor family protein [Phycisphaerales bacterium]